MRRRRSRCNSTGIIKGGEGRSCVYGYRRSGGAVTSLTVVINIGITIWEQCVACSTAGVSDDVIVC